MKKNTLTGLALLPVAAFANDSTGFLSTGGVEYIKNDNIAMVSEDLYLSTKQVRVHYQYKNLTDKEITETILFPLPIVDSEYDYDFADVGGLLKSFKIFANGKSIKPKMNVRAFMYPKKADGTYDYDGKQIDVTEAFKKCGLSDKEIISNWTKTPNSDTVTAKLLKCNEKQIQELKPSAQENPLWSSQVIYSWQQTFAPNAFTEIKHEYQPLVGGGLDAKLVAKDPESNLAKIYCINKGSEDKFVDHAGFNEMGYILTTGANWAKPIEKFNLTIAYQPKEQVHFCWKGSEPKIVQNGKNYELKVQESNFKPQQDLDLLFVPTK